MNQFPPFRATTLEDLVIQLNAAAETWDSHTTEFNDLYGRVNQMRKIARTPSSATDVLSSDRENDITWDSDNFYFLTDVSGTLKWKSIPASSVFGSDGILYTNVTQVANVGTGEDDLMTYTLPGGTLTANGDSLVITAHGTFGAGSAQKDLKFYFGGTSVTINSGTSSVTQWVARIYINRVDATNQHVFGLFSLGPTLNTDDGFITTATETLASDVAIKFTGESTTSNNVIQYSMKIKLESSGG